MHPTQPQMPVDVRTLRVIIQEDIDHVTAKSAVHEDAIQALQGILDSDELESFPVVARYIGVLQAQAKLDLEFDRRQLRVLEERMRRISSCIVTPVPVPGQPLS